MIPENNTLDSYDFEEVFKGNESSVIEINLTPAFYSNFVKDFDLAGYRVYSNTV